MPRKATDIATAIAQVQAGQAVMVGGFGRGGTPFTLIDYLADRPAIYRDLTIYKNDANEPGLGIGRLFANRQVKKLITTHIGLNPDFIKQMNAGEVLCEFVPQGIFAEKIRAGGAGIPAFLSDIGLGTSYELDKDKLQLEGKEYILERAFRADVALVCADRADEAGNCWWQGSNRNMCVAMAMACDRVIVEVKEIVPMGTIAPENVHLPGVFVHSLVAAAARRHRQGEAA